MPPSDGEKDTERPRRPVGLQRFGAAAALLAALLLSIGTLSYAWWRGGGEEGPRFAVGLRGVELCTGGRCAEQGLDALGAPESWERIGVAAFAAGAVAALFLVVAAVSALRGGGRFFPRVAAATSLFALGVGTAFALLVPEAGLSPGYGQAVFLIGAALGVGSAGAVLARALA